MKTEPHPPLKLPLDERNLAQFLAAHALAGLAGRIPGEAQESRTCWWADEERFAIQTEFGPEEFRQKLFQTAHEFLKGLNWVPGLGGVAHGVLSSNGEIGINPFVALTGDGKETTLLKGFSARVVPKDVLPQQVAELKAPNECGDWLAQLRRNINSWGLDWRTSAHASDAGYSSDAEGTGYRDPIYIAVELLSLTAAAFFVAVHGWQITRNRLQIAAWTKPIPLDVVPFAGGCRLVGLPARIRLFAYRGASHGKGAAYHFFPEGIPDTTTINS